MAEGGSARARAEELWARAAAERQKEEAARALAESLEAQAGAWDAGAAGERRVASALARLPDEWVVLHDRLLRPGRSGVNLDHVVVGPSGIFLVDAKNWAGGTSVHDGNLWQHTGRSAPKGAELDRLSRFAGEMEKALGVPVAPVVALAGGQGSRFRSQRVRGVDIVPCARLARWLRGQPAGTDAITVDLLSRKVAHTYPPASPEDPLSVPAADGIPAWSVRDVVGSSRPVGHRTDRRPGRAPRRTRSRRRPRSLTSTLVALAALVALVYVGPRVIPRLVEIVVDRLTTGSRIDLLPGEASAWLPQGTTLSGWKGHTWTSQPSMLSLRFTYPEGASAKQVRAAEAAAGTRVARLAEELALAARSGT